MPGAGRARLGRRRLAQEQRQHDENDEDAGQGEEDVVQAGALHTEVVDLDPRLLQAGGHLGGQRVAVEADVLDGGPGRVDAGDGTLDKMVGKYR